MSKDTPVTVYLQPEQLAALDAWIQERQQTLSREDAIKALLQKSLPKPNTTRVRGEFG